jgi:Toprim-like/Protein of unknown function (DUF3991)
MFDPELDAFKASIDLRAYAGSLNYTLDRTESWTGSAVMRHANGDKIIIKRDADGHYVYFSVRDDRDHGTIIDFVQRRLRLSLGEIRKTLRPWIGRQAEIVPYPPLQATRKDRAAVEAEFAGMVVTSRHPYLEEERALPCALLQSVRFAGRIRAELKDGIAFPNAVFPHFDDQGLCGYEIKNSRGFTGFAKGGSKGLWLSYAHQDDNQILFCESAIDALSYAVLFPSDRMRFASIGGKLNPTQPGLVLAAILSMPKGSEVLAAMDADADGDALNGVIREAVEFSGRPDLRFTVHEPSGFKDWNDQLRERPKRSASSQPHVPFVA